MSLPPHWSWSDQLQKQRGRSWSIPCSSRWVVDHLKLSAILSWPDLLVQLQPWGTGKSPLVAKFINRYDWFPGLSPNLSKSIEIHPGLWTWTCQCQCLREVFTQSCPSSWLKRLSFGIPGLHRRMPFAHCWPSRMGLSHCQGARARFPGFGTWSQSGANQLRSHQPWEKNIAATWCNPQPFDNMLRGLDMLWYVFFPGQHGWQSNPFVLSYCMFMCLHGSASHAFHSEIFRIIWHMNAH